MKKKLLVLLAVSSLFITGCFTNKKENFESQKAALVTAESFVEEGDTAIAGVEGDNGARYYLGAKKMDNEEMRSLQVAPNPSISANTVLPRKKDLSANFPVPGNQGSQNSCTAWAVAYAYKSSQEKLDQGWEVDSDERIFSPSYVYNQINGGKDAGSYIHEAMQLVVNQGIATLDMFPYSHFLTQPSQAAREEAKNFKAKSWGTIPSGDIDRMKRHLASGDAIVIGIPVYSDFVNLSPSNPIYGDASGELAEVHGYHAITVVGYDDDKQALKIINSWGPNWGINGYGWIAYDFMRSQSKNIQAYTMVDIKNKVNDNTNTDTTKVPVIGSIGQVEEGQDIVISGSNFEEGAVVYIRTGENGQEATIKSINSESIVVQNNYSAGDYSVWVRNADSNWSEQASLRVIEKVVIGNPVISYISGNSSELIISGENFAARDNLVYIRGNNVSEYMTINSSTSNEIRVRNRYSRGVYQVWVKTKDSNWSDVYYLRLY